MGKGERRLGEEVKLHRRMSQDLVRARSEEMDIRELEAWSDSFHANGKCHHDIS